MKELLDPAVLHEHVGGKAFFLSTLVQAGLPVPAGIVLQSCPAAPVEWQSLFDWWTREGRPAVAVRSSATDEDSPELSFAGQYETLLDIRTERDLENAVVSCFGSLHRANRAAYRERFREASPAAHGSVARMNVVVQRMIDPRAAGVYFTSDPMEPEAGWLIEWVDGLGDALVSGRRTPTRVHRDQCGGAAGSDIARVLLPVVERVERILTFPVDLEWAIDHEGNPWVLQARPITARSSAAPGSRAIARGVARLEARNAAGTSWDGHPFAEWSGVPTALSFSIWARAFGAQGALGRALSSLGYLGGGQAFSGTTLDRVLGRPYVNLRRMDELLFGRSPFATEPWPQPHVAFRWDRANGAALLRAPLASFYMARASWRSAGSGRKRLQACREAYASQVQQGIPPNNPSLYQSQTLATLLSAFDDAARDFSESLLLQPMLLILLIERSAQRVRQLLAKAVPAGEVDALLHRCLGQALNSATLEMDRQYEIACADTRMRPEYLREYGHRAAGELDLARPRWIERGNRVFAAFERPSPAPDAPRSSSDPESMSAGEPAHIPRFYRPLYLQESALLKEMLAVREEWKHLVMRPYAHLRWMALEIGRRTGLGDLVFQLTATELNQFARGKAGIGRLQRAASLRAARDRQLRDVHLPMIVTLDSLKSVAGRATTASGPLPDILHGQALSPGLACGEVRVVRHPDDLSTTRWPADTILVAEATDPGWTALFLRVKGVVIERGGVLSHCAIVAREMRLPAVSGVLNCCTQLKDGQRIWVDGNRGHVQFA